MRSAGPLVRRSSSWPATLPIIPWPHPSYHPLQEPPSEFAAFTARDVMARSVVVLREVERVGDLVAVLKRTHHNGFPVVQKKHSKTLCGLILRREPTHTRTARVRAPVGAATSRVRAGGAAGQLLFLLQHRVWRYNGQVPQSVVVNYISSVEVTKGGVAEAAQHTWAQARDAPLLHEAVGPAPRGGRARPSRRALRRAVWRGVRVR